VGSKLTPLSPRLAKTFESTIAFVAANQYAEKTYSK
jgi:hypothetical protein